VTASVHTRVFPNSYRDSVELMRIASEIEGLDGVARAGLVMATPANCEVLTAAGLFEEGLASAGPNDLVVAVSASDAEVATAALDIAAARLAGSGSGGAGDAGTATRANPQTIADGVDELGAADVALISTPGTYATAEALKALKRGLHVFLFSDNVPIEDEIELKTLARRKGRLVMGPDCGTAILDGVPLGFANAVRRGSIGLVAASGTGLQQVTCLIDRFGAGVSQAIGVGGRDLDERVGGTMMLAGIERLAADKGTDVLVLISKPPAASVTAEVLRVAAKAGKPVIVNFLGGDADAIRAAGLVPAPTFEVAAQVAANLAVGRNADDPIGGADRDGRSIVDAARAAAASLATGQWRVRGLFSGGSLAGEAKLILKATHDVPAGAYEILDLGEDEYTVGRPHPMIDPRLRNEMIVAAGQDSATAVILLDVVLGYGSNADPAGALVPAIEEARAAAAAEGRSLAVVASVCGTEADPQHLSEQERRLAAADVILAPSNARAARIAAAIAAIAAERMVPEAAGIAAASEASAGAAT
jgi:succinyl-CoA synthetase alpha subunit